MAAAGPRVANVDADHSALSDRFPNGGSEKRGAVEPRATFDDHARPLLDQELVMDSQVIIQIPLVSLPNCALRLRRPLNDHYNNLSTREVLCGDR